MNASEPVVGDYGFFPIVPYNPHRFGDAETTTFVPGLVVGVGRVTIGGTTKVIAVRTGGQTIRNMRRHDRGFPGDPLLPVFRLSTGDCRPLTDTSAANPLWQILTFVVGTPPHKHCPECDGKGSARLYGGACEKCRLAPGWSLHGLRLR